MAEPRIVGVLDVGKSNVKLALVDTTERVEIAVRKAPNEVRPDGPYPHFDVDRLWAFFEEALADLSREHPPAALSVTSHGASGALLGQGGLAMPVLDYEHDGPDTVSAAYDAVRPAFAETRSPRLPLGLNLGAQLFWQQATFPDAFARMTAILTYPQYWVWRLTGIAATEMTSLGCHTDLWNPAQRRPSSLLARCGWSERLAPVRSAFDPIGLVRPEIAQRLGLVPGMPVACGIHDSNASLLPHLLQRRAPFATVSTGTWVVVLAVGGNIDRLDPTRDSLANVDAFGDPVASARFMGGREFEILSAGAVETADPAALAQILKTGVMILPSFVRGSGPFPRSHGRWTVDPQSLARRLRAAAIGLYLALMTETCLSLTGAAGETIVEGPLAGDPIYLRALAAFTGRPVIVEQSAGTGTAIGAALLATGQGRTAAAELLGDRILPPSDNTAFAAYALNWRRSLGG